MEQNTPPPQTALARSFFDGLVTKAVAKLREKPLPIYTFAFFHSHEDGTVSVFVDTKENSASAVLSSHIFDRAHFVDAVKHGDLKWVGLFRANTGRNLNVGDFALEVAHAKLGLILMDDEAYISMIRAVMAQEEQIAAFAESREELLFCCSSADDEVGYLWTLALVAP